METASVRTGSISGQRGLPRWPPVLELAERCARVPNSPEEISLDRVFDPQIS
jgi:hypothetical protein